MPTRSYPVADPVGFPDGLKCMGCDLGIDTGQPYKEVPYGITDADEIMVDLHCVYC